MIYSQRGTKGLNPEQVPRKMSGRAQPYRKRKPRQLGPTLEAILRSEPAYLPNPADLWRVREHELRRLYGR